jgi:hypothetical protein
MPLEGAASYDHVSKYTRHESYVRPRRTVSISRSKVAGALQRPKGMTINCHKPCPVENAVFSLSSGCTLLANNRSSGLVWRTIWLPPACPRCRQFWVVEDCMEHNFWLIAGKLLLRGKYLVSAYLNKYGFRVVLVIKFYKHTKTSQVIKGSSEHVSELYSLNAKR